MSKFNKKTKVSVTNLAGGKAYKQTDKMEFVSILLTSFVKDQFYRSENETVEKIQELYAGLKDQKFGAKSAIYARTKFGMRSVSHIVAREVARIQNQEWTKNFFEKIVYRPDDMLEIISLYLNTNSDRKLPNSMRKGFAKVISTLNEYKLAKYKGEGKDVSMVDLVNLVHPKSTPALTKLMTGKLKPAETWETKLTQAGQEAETEEQKEELKGSAWRELIINKQIGYFALLRNLRNIMEQAPDVLDKALEMLVDEKLIKDSLVLPFRFSTAGKEISKISNSRKVLTAISKALEISLANVPTFDGRTLVVLDTSGSMSGQPAEIGSLFSAVLYKANDADFMNFSDRAEYHTLNASDSVMTIADSMHFRSGGTNFHSIFETANQPYDRIFILSDMQGWMTGGLGQMGGAPTSAFTAYKKRTNCNPKVYSFDLAGYGSLQFPEPDVYCIAGFSDKIFNTIKLLETDKQALVNEIEAIEL